VLVPLLTASQVVGTEYDLNKHFAGRGQHVPASTVQMLSDRLSKALKRFLAAREAGIPNVGFPRFKKPNRWHSIQLRQHKTDFSLAPDGKHLSLPKKLGGPVKINTPILRDGYVPLTLLARPCTRRAGGEKRMRAIRSHVSPENCRARHHC
jgi:hypothetical protein